MTWCGIIAAIERRSLICRDEMGQGREVAVKGRETGVAVARGVLAVVVLVAGLVARKASARGHRL